MTDIAEAIRSIDSTVSATVKNNEYDTIEWLKGGPISKELIDLKIKDLQAAYDTQAYARSRKEEYDALNQFEMISDDSINGTTTHKDAIVAIKAKYPKPE